MTQNGKGDKPRPKSVSRKTFAENWDLAFKPRINHSNTNALERCPNTIDMDLVVTTKK